MDEWTPDQVRNAGGSPLAVQIAEVLAKSPGSNFKGIADALNIDEVDVSNGVKELEALGAVQRERGGFWSLKSGPRPGSDPGEPAVGVAPTWLPPRESAHGAVTPSADAIAGELATWSAVERLVTTNENHPDANYTIVEHSPEATTFLLEWRCARGQVQPIWLFTANDMHGDEWVIVEAPLGDFAEELAMRVAILSSMPPGCFGAYGKPNSSGPGAVGLRWSGRTSVTTIDSVGVHLMELANMTQGLLEVL